MRMHMLVLEFAAHRNLQERLHASAILILLELLTGMRRGPAPQLTAIAPRPLPSPPACMSFATACRLAGTENSEKVRGCKCSKRRRKVWQ